MKIWVNLQIYLCSLKVPRILLFTKILHTKLRWLVWGCKNTLATKLPTLNQLLRVHSADLHSGVSVPAQLTNLDKLGDQVLSFSFCEDNAFLVLKIVWTLFSTISDWNFSVFARAFIHCHFLGLLCCWIKPNKTSYIS